jgi:hypothetical protein
MRSVRRVVVASGLPYDMGHRGVLAWNVARCVAEGRGVPCSLSAAIRRQCERERSVDVRPFARARNSCPSLACEGAITCVL